MATITTMEQQSKKLQVAVFPWLAFGHSVPFFELAKLIAQKGHKIFFISTPRNIQRLPKLPPNLEHSMNLIEIPLPHVEELPENAEATMDVPNNSVAYLKKAFDGLEQPLVQFLQTSKPDWIIYDFAPYWLPPINAKLGILGIFFCIFSAFGTSLIFDTLVLQASKTFSEVALRPFEEKTMSNDHVEENESGVSDVFRVRSCLYGAHVLASRSCREIDGESLKILESQCRKPVFPTGLLPPSLESSEDSKHDNWDTIVEWLDKQEKGSVVYVAFGSEVTLSEEDLTELALGLELSGLPFLWILNKQNSPASSYSIDLPDWFEHRSNYRGFVWTS
ncbi:hypothetical protein L6164_003565 [Bauhinia variegata]|uniref:Uncharacterized protein n=1 Tax=Bauhinia variegata TaxID=167791 RepID=A0ACB9Q0U0_BAUVA|nr:hypothetical protein L6164_003565 [Bauhinia variegata]